MYCVQHTIYFFVFLGILISNSQTVDVEPRIINGVPASSGQFPWQAALFFQGPPPDSSFWLCSGTIISDTWILTAGHCANNAEEVFIYTGIIDISLDMIPTAIVKDIILHENFKPESLANDIALIKLSDKIEFDDKVQAISLSSKEVDVGTTITISGWGKTRANDTSMSPLLHYVNLVTISNDKCQEAYGDSGIILPEMVCAAVDPALMQSPCHGDSGGPVVINLDTDPKHVAVASFVSDTGCESGLPSGYTRTASYINWIKEKTGI